MVAPSSGRVRPLCGAVISCVLRIRSAVSWPTVSTPSVLLVCASSNSPSANLAVLEVAALAAGTSARVLKALPAVPVFSPSIDPEPEPVMVFKHQVRMSEAVLIAAPEYAGGLAGGAKNLLDWCVGTGDLYGKPAAVMSAGTTGGVYAREELVRTLLWQGAHVVGSVGIEAPRTKVDHTGRVVDEATIAAIDRLVSDLVDATRQTPGERVVRVREMAASIGVDPRRVPDG